MKWAIIALASAWLAYEVVSLVIAAVRKAKYKKIKEQEENSENNN